MKILASSILIFCFTSCANRHLSAQQENKPLGHFVDDYKIEYQISDSLFFQLPANKYHILAWHATYIIAKNDAANSSEAGLYTRIDFTRVNDMKPFQWAFCYTNYAAESPQEAMQTIAADKSSLRTGCNGYPFSRLRPKK